MHAIGKAADPLVQVVDFLIAIDQTTLQIEDADDPGEVDALAGELVDKGQALDILSLIHIWLFTYLNRVFLLLPEKGASGISAGQVVMALFLERKPIV